MENAIDTLIQDLRVAVIYDDTLRPDTTGGYCLRALQSLAFITPAAE